MSGCKAIVLHDDEKTLSAKRLLLERCRVSFEKQFGDSSDDRMCAAVAPGRVNLIGEHIDYCDGFVLPMAIPLYTMTYGRKAKDPTRGYTMVYSAALDEVSKISRPYDNRDCVASSEAEPSWSRYIRGVLALYPHSVDADFVIESTIPAGSGLSSSASLELATLFLLRQLTDLIDDDGMRREDCAVMCRRAENIFAHVPCGIMDQMAVCLAEKDHALKIDCWNLATESVPVSVNGDIAFLLTDCGVRHKLAGSEYSNRKQSVDDALKKLDKKSWRNIHEEALRANSDILEEAQMEHALHVVSETRRTDEAANALLDNDLLKFGHLMNESHISLRDRYRVSCAELDELVKLALSIDGVFGSRMTGGGFGGCTITMLRKDKLETLKKHIKENYSGKPTFYECRPVAGVEEFPVDGVYNVI
ncbi:Galactokinase [Toxocara canis]|uniref:Galactokinase n=2 Tax=Toxocara canis TaxID=6265 RepID=A0A0B2VTC2_TOXCA|nr:Galactokinase [Toxocara canis]VDM36559.1 unnamed protein product [Toxocara canis]